MDGVVCTTLSPVSNPLDKQIHLLHDIHLLAQRQAAVICLAQQVHSTRSTPHQRGDNLAVDAYCRADLQANITSGVIPLDCLLVACMTFGDHMALF